MSSKNFLRASLLLMALAVGVGCARPRTVEPPAPVAPVLDSGRDTVAYGDMAFSGGATVPFTPNANNFPQYVVTHPLNAPTNYKLNVNLSDFGAGRFGGSVTIAYNDNGKQLFYSTFSTGTGNVNVSYQGRDAGKSVAEFNRWVSAGNNSVAFRGFFQDKWGAIILVLDGGLGLGDGGLPTDMSGKLYFKNFSQMFGNQSNEKCWFIRISPYDCRTYLDARGEVNPTAGVYPGNGYQELATFSDLDQQAAFNR